MHARRIPISLEKAVLDHLISRPHLILLIYFGIKAIGKGDFIRVLIKHWHKRDS